MIELEYPITHDLFYPVLHVQPPQNDNNIITRLTKNIKYFMCSPILPRYGSLTVLGACGHSTLDVFSLSPQWVCILWVIIFTASLVIRPAFGVSEAHCLVGSQEGLIGSIVQFVHDPYA